MELIWKFFEGDYKVHCRSREHAKEIGWWSGSVRDAVYFYPDGHIEEDVVIPARQLRRAQILVGQRTEPEITRIVPVVGQ